MEARKKGPWTITGRETVYENKWIKVIEDDVIRPDGKEGMYTTVEILPGVTILPVDEDGNVYLSTNYQYAVEQDMVVACGGGIDSEEDILDAAKRELKEESGLAARQWVDMGEVHAITSGIISSPNRMYLALGVTEGDQKLEGTENITIFKLPLGDAVQQVMDGAITHAATALLILKAQVYLSSHPAGSV